ncbi:MAG: signal peptidase II [Clostridia bacterium]
MGNFVDRCFRGFVVDFLYFKFIDFPVFNVADCYVVIGCIAAACVLLFDKNLLDGKPKEEST